MSKEAILRLNRKLSDIPGLRLLVDIKPHELAKIVFADGDVYRARAAIAANPGLENFTYVIEPGACEPILAWAHKNRSVVSSFVTRFSRAIANGEHHPILDVRHFDDNAALWNGNQRLLAQKSQGLAIICVIFQGVDRAVIEYEGDAAKQEDYMRMKRMLDFSPYPEWQQQLMTSDSTLKRMCSILAQIRAPGASNKSSTAILPRETMTLLYGAMPLLAQVATRWPASHTMPNPLLQDTVLRKPQYKRVVKKRISTGFSQACCSAPAMIALASGMALDKWTACVETLFSSESTDDASMQPIILFKEYAKRMKSTYAGRDTPETAMYYAFLDALWMVHTGKIGGSLFDYTTTTKRPSRYMRWTPKCPLTLDDLSPQVVEAVKHNGEIPTVVDGGYGVRDSKGKVIKLVG